MAHVKKTYVAREGVDLNKFNKIAETTSSVILQNAPTSVSVAGTPFSVTWMNDLETTAAQLSNLNAVTDIDDIPALGTGVYTGTGITGAPTSDTIVYEYKGEETAGVLVAKPVSGNYGQIWERRRSGSAWVTGWMLKSGWGTMAENTEYLCGYTSDNRQIVRQIITGSYAFPSGSTGTQTPYIDNFQKVIRLSAITSLYSDFRSGNVVPSSCVTISTDYMYLQFARTLSPYRWYFVLGFNNTSGGTVTVYYRITAEYELTL